MSTNYNLYLEQLNRNLGDISNAPLIPQENTQNPNVPPMDMATYLGQQYANNQQAFQPTSQMSEVSPNIGENFIRNAQEFGTGVTHLITHPEDLVTAGIDYFSDPDLTFGKVLGDTANMILAPYNTQVQDFGNKPAREIVANIIRGIHEHPFDVTLDAISLGGAKLLGKIFPSLSKGSKVEQGLATIGAETAPDVEKIYDGFKNITKNARDKGVDLERVLQSAETGDRLTSQAEKAIFKEMKEFSHTYDDIAKKYSPNTYLGHEETAITQNILRKRLTNGLPDTTYAQVEREITPMLDLIKEGKKSEVLQMAKDGNQLAREVIGAKTLYDKGRIFPVSHGLANVERVGEEVTRKIGDYAGAFSRRAYGTSSYGDIAKQWVKPQEFLQGTIERYGHGAIAQNLLRGELGGQSIAPLAERSARFLNAEMLRDGKLLDALADAKKTKVFADDIAVDSKVLESLKRQVAPDGALTGLFKDLYNTGKSTLLASGTYLGANVTTGIANMLINSGVFVLDDILHAIATRGSLAKKLGVYRRRTLPRVTETPVLKQIQQLNRLTGAQLFSNADRLLQNTLAEVGAHAELRRAGIRGAERADAVDKLSRQKLGQVIADIKRDALINSPNIPLPKWAENVAYAYNPFWRWLVTSGQASVKMLEKSPLMSNVILSDIMANIGFDQEMQNRLNLNVSLDKPYTSYRIDDRTGKIKEVTAEFLPITTPIKALDPKGRFKSTIPVLDAIRNSFEGKDKYGKPLKFPIGLQGEIRSAVGGKTFKYDNENGWHEAGFDPTDVLTQTIKETIGGVNLYNKTIAPILSDMAGMEGFYQPYSGSLLGSYIQTPYGNQIIGGNPANIRSASDVLNAFRGQYVRDYNPALDAIGANDTVSPRTIRQIIRNQGRQVGRTEWR